MCSGCKDIEIMDKKTCAIVVTYNRVDLLKKCIFALLAQTITSFDIILIDNGSTDETAKYIKEEYGNEPRIKYYNPGVNIGGAGGFSYGIKKSVIMGYEHLWLMDDDTIPEPDALEILISTGRKLNDQYGFLSSYAKWIDGSACEMNVPEISPLWRNNVELQFSNRIIRLSSASFVSMFLRAEVVRKIGLPIKEFFIWADDMEYSKRISRVFPCYFVFDSQVIHEMKSNTATTILQASGDRLSRYKYLYRNRYYIAKRGRKLELFEYFVYIKNTLREIVSSNNKNKIKMVYIVIKSTISGVFFDPKIEYVD